MDAPMGEDALDKSLDELSHLAEIRGPDVAVIWKNLSTFPALAVVAEDPAVVRRNQITSLEHELAVAKDDVAASMQLSTHMQLAASARVESIQAEILKCSIAAGPNIVAKPAGAETFEVLDRRRAAAALAQAAWRKSVKTKKELLWQEVLATSQAAEHAIAALKDQQAALTTVFQEHNEKWEAFNAVVEESHAAKVSSLEVLSKATRRTPPCVAGADASTGDICGQALAPLPAVQVDCSEL